MASKLSDMDMSELTKLFEGIRGDITSLTDQITKIAKAQADSANSRVQAAAGNVSDAVHGTAERLARTGQDFASGAQDHLRSASAELEDQIGRNPWTAIMVAGAVGLMMGLLSRRSD